jgi:hypothetical protein
MKRQDHATWDTSYVPAILASRGEAPSVSHALTIISKKLAGREVHLLSLSELFAALLGLYHPNVVGLQEQRMLSTTPRQHPLHNFPNVIAAGLTSFKGMIDVAERLGYLQRLPRVYAIDKGARRGIVFPYVGDLLWAVRGANGGYYCINWSVKDSESAFKRPFQYQRLITRTDQVSEGPLARHELERTYYSDAGIRTVLVAGDAINEHVRSNLRHLFLHHSRAITINEAEKLELLARFQSCLETGTPPSELIVRLTGAGKYSLEDCKNIFYQGIWHRRLRIDLLRPVLINRPLHPETQDITELYADWFSEDACQ